MLLLLSGIEQNPGEFLEIPFFLSMFILYEQILCSCYLSHHLISIKHVQVLKILPSYIRQTIYPMFGLRERWGQI